MKITTVKDRISQSLFKFIISNSMESLIEHDIFNYYFPL